MLTDQTVAIIGAGNIGRSLIGGMLKGDEFDPTRIRATRRNEGAIGDLQAQFPGITVSDDNVAAVTGATVVVLAIKPQHAVDVIGEIRESVSSDAMIVSVLAGLTCAALESAFGKELAVIRTMPNTPMIVDEGATAISAGVRGGWKGRDRAGIFDGRGNGVVWQWAGVCIYVYRSSD